MSASEEQNHLQIVATADGSNTIYNALVGENYHSRNGAHQESRHVFLQQGLQHFISLQQAPPTSISVLEVGLGTGLNFLLTADYCTTQNIHLDYCGIEAYPLSAEMMSQTGYHQYTSAPLWQSFLEHYPASLSAPAGVNDFVTLQTVHSQLQTFTSDKKFNVIYFDAFASAHQPEMWTDEAIAHTISFLKPGGVFVTYAITGNLKRCIKSLGLKVEKAPGAPGKREMLRAIAS
ncbi:tRNA (5-methylaminomethyl-2-thiouridine)(34)-methyltransferase MnmD [Mucilaginibacter pedocola]|uniref:tRNA (5-methylaminomethyl-2-thiouridylate)-methyltransferase n=1 Tax=Mucilaginibacter pedocola TaxID=1792845 RepID=A0A1S9PE80_9SPHI|nr:tRNA (5-methylaminomethyl-2-thiouridine)(34)-methyltransferase MnmD [Mucilaginibacter pedocola]OOQ59262.1 tRNA (5-methylaminomethyl-2-thiouridylate)-methyltransferase [Mucilaginibacter pedocola]